MTVSAVFVTVIFVVQPTTTDNYPTDSSLTVAYVTFLIILMIVALIAVVVSVRS